MIEFNCSRENIAKTLTDNLLDRNKHILRLAQFIDSATECTTYAVDGTWGSGKTVFAHQLKYVLDLRLNSEEIPEEIFAQSDELPDSIYTHYFNAWENDTIQNPTYNILIDLMNKDNTFTWDEIQKFKDGLRLVANLALRKTTGVGVDDLKVNSDKEWSDDYSQAQKIKEEFNKCINKILAKNKQINC